MRNNENRPNPGQLPASSLEVAGEGRWDVAWSGGEKATSDSRCEDLPPYLQYQKEHGSIAAVFLRGIAYCAVVFAVDDWSLVSSTEKGNRQEPGMGVASTGDLCSHVCPAVLLTVRCQADVTAFLLHSVPVHALGILRLLGNSQCSLSSERMVGNHNVDHMLPVVTS